MNRIGLGRNLHALVTRPREEAVGDVVAPVANPGALVTRPREEAEGLAAALKARGIGAIIEPLLEVHYHAGVACDLAGVQAVLCTSANGVRALARASRQRTLPLFAVGDATAARARAEGFPAVTSAGGDSRDLARLAAARLHPQHGRLLHVAGDVVTGDLVGALQAQGFTVDRQVLYEVWPVAALSSATVDALRSGSIDFALFFSPRTAAVFAQLVANARATECCGAVTALSISLTADAALGGLPWQDRRIAKKPNQAALLDTLDGLLEERAR